jgi:hypothetical protein
MSDKKPLPKPDDVLKGVIFDNGSSPSEISRPEKEYLRRFQSISVDGQVQYAHLKGIRDHYKHKERWSNFLILAIAAMLMFQSYLLIQVGLGVWDFSKYEWLLPALLVQNLTQVVGLSVWAVKYLFSDISNQKVK